MADIESRLKERASALAPSASQQQSAARSHNYLRDVLLTGNMECRINASYLSGSYARQTAIRPLDDVDVVFEIDPERWRRNALARFLDLLPTPGAVLETFARAIRLRYPDSKVRTQRRSVGLVMDHLHIDVVPAVVDEEHEDWLRIPDLEADRWITTAPKVHSATATSINSKRSERFKPLVRLLKGWNAGLPATAGLKSFAIETLAARIFSHVDIPSLAGGMHRYFDFIAAFGGNSSTLEWNNSYGVRFGGWQGAVLPDVAGTGSNLFAGSTDDRLTKFVAASRIMRDQVVAALNASTSDTGWEHLDHRLRAGLERL